jgi:acyl-CoA synthetase (AMP-forming)/AMP-acid ligase II
VPPSVIEFDRFSSFSALLERWRRDRPAHAAIVQNGAAVSWSELARIAEDLECSLLRQGFQPGDRLMVNVPDCPLLVAAIAAIDSLRGIYVPLNVKLHPAEIDAIAAATGARFLLRDGDVTVLDRPACEWLAAGPTSGHRLQQDFAVGITSATTGASKAIVVNQFSVLSTGTELAAAMQLGADDRIATLVPLTSHFNLCSSIPALFHTGSTLVLGAPKTGAVAWAAGQGATTLVGVPTNFVQMLREGYAAPGLRAIVAGSVCDEWVVRGVRDRLGIALCNHYGMSECGGVSTVRLDDTDGAIVFRSTGRPFPWVETRVENGEILVRTPGIFRSALTERAEMQKRISPDGWLHTGDLGSIGPRGEIRIAGRSGDMAIRAGNNVFFAEIESVLRSSPAVGDVVAFSLPDALLGEALCACIVPKDGAAPSAGDLLAFAAGRLPAFKVPDYLAFVPSIETTVNGKVLRRSMQSQAQANAWPLHSRT